MSRRDPRREGPRRIQHAHRVRVPVGPIEGRAARFAGRRGRHHPGLAALAGLAVIALAVAVLRPWEATLESSRGAGATDASGAPARIAADVAPSLGARGDTVPSIGGRAGRDDAWPPAAAGPLPAGLLTGYAWPIRNARITNSYGLGRPGSFLVDGVPFHDGLDIASFCGARITAAHDGVVLVASRRNEGYLGWVGDLGPFRAKLAEKGGWGGQAITVVVDDGNGYRSIYAHLGLAAVEKGDIVRAGDLVGWEGASGNATGCHLHFALFSPLETATLALDPKVAKKTKLPAFEIARIDPLLVLPPPSEANITWGWGAR